MSIVHRQFSPLARLWAVFGGALRRGRRRLSRRTGWALALLLAAPPIFARMLPLPSPPSGAIAQAKGAYGPADTRAANSCPPPKPGDEIVVCAEPRSNRNFASIRAGDLDPAGAGARGGVPRAPDVGHVYPPGQVSVSGCFIPPCPPPMPKIIDLKAIPEAPPGSDADRVARGLAPTGRDRPAEPRDLPPAAAPRNED